MKTRIAIAAALTAALTLSAAPQVAQAEDIPTSVGRAVETGTTQTLAEQAAYGATMHLLRRSVRLQERGIIVPWHRFMRDTKAWRSVPDRYRVYVKPGDLRPVRNGLVKRRITFTTGNIATAACLDLRFGYATRGACGEPRQTRSDDLASVYRNLVRASEWVDRRRGVLGQGGRDVQMVARIAAAELPSGWTATFQDADDDGRVDRGWVSLRQADGDGCGLVTLPQRVPGGYDASMHRCTA